MSLVPSTAGLPSLMRSLLREPLRKAADVHQGRRVLEKQKQIVSFYSNAVDRQKELQRKLISRTLIDARSTCFYKSRIKPGLHEKVLEDARYLMDVPITRKEDILENSEAFVNTSYMPQGALYKASTNGSTGPAAILFYDQDAADWSSATTWYCRNTYESWLSNTTVHLASNLIDNSKPLPALSDWMRFYATNRFNLFVNDLDEESLKNYALSLTKHKINILHGQPSLASAISVSIPKLTNSHMPIIRYFESTGETLLPSYAKNIEIFLGCRCINRYGLAEFGVVAYQLDLKQKNLKTMDHLVEFTNLGTESTPQLTITSLRNRYFPLINYDPGDNLEFDNSSARRAIKPPHGRVHTNVRIGSKIISTGLIMDIMNHRVSDVIDFQIDMAKPDSPVLYVALAEQSRTTVKTISESMLRYAGIIVTVKTCDYSSLIRTGRRQKYSHILGSKL